MKILRLDAFSGLVYGVEDNGDVLVTRSDASLCEIASQGLDWKPAPPHKVPVTLKGWIADQEVPPIP